MAGYYHCVVADLGSGQRPLYPLYLFDDNGGQYGAQSDSVSKTRIEDKVLWLKGGYLLDLRN